jgi:predicted transcriptional regulator
MERKQKKGSGGADTLAQPSPSDLMGRQSVRATFRLSERAVNAISIIAGQLGIKQKSVLDHLLEDMDALSVIARRIRSEKPKPRGRIQKTYVVSRRTLTVLERIARDFAASRDALLEQSVKRLQPLIAAERERHAKRKEVLEDLRAFLAQGEALLNRSRDLLGEDDPVHALLEAAVGSLDAARDQAEVLVERGKEIEEY